MPSIFGCVHFTSLLRITFAVLQKSCQINFEKFQGSSKSRIGVSQKDHYFLKIPKWQHKLVQDYKRGKLVSCFRNNADKNVYIDQKFQRVSKLSMSFGLKHFSISVAFSSKVVSVPLKQEHLFMGIIFFIIL